MATGPHDFEQFMNQRKIAAQAYVRGDPEPLDGIVARCSPATFFAPAGGSLSGTAPVAARYREDAALFGSDGTTDFDIIDAAESDDLAYWTGIQHADVRMGNGKTATMDLRITEIFRREGKDWKLVHRHADPLVAERKGKA